MSKPGFVPTHLGQCLHAKRERDAGSGGGAWAEEQQQRGIAQIRPAPFPAGRHSFLCVPISAGAGTRAGWRNEVVHEVAKELGAGLGPVLPRFDALKDR